MTKKKLVIKPPQPSERLCIIVKGDKGGVGKSFVSKLLLELFLSKGIDISLADVDVKNPDVARAYHTLIPTYDAVFSEVPGKQHKADVIFQTKEHVVVNLPANIQEAFSQWLITDEQYVVAQELGIKVVIMFVSNGSYDSMQLFLQSCTTMSEVQHIFARNLFFCSEEEWGVLETPELQQVIQSYRVPVISIPRLDPWVRNVLQETVTPFSVAANEWRDCNIPLWDASKAQRVKRLLRASFVQLEQGLSTCNAFPYP